MRKNKHRETERKNNELETMEDIFLFIIIYFLTFLYFFLIFCAAEKITNSKIVRRFCMMILPLSFAFDINAKKNSSK